MSVLFASELLGRREETHRYWDDPASPLPALWPEILLHLGVFGAQPDCRRRGKLLENLGLIETAGYELWVKSRGWTRRWAEVFQAHSTAKELTETGPCNMAQFARTQAGIELDQIR